MKKLLLTISMAAVLGLLSCGNPEIAGTGANTLYPVSVQVFAKAQASSTYHITITGPKMAQIGPDEYSGGQTIEIYIPVGVDRRIYLERYNAQGVRTDTGSIITVISSGINEISENRVTITLQSAIPTYIISFNSRGGSIVASQTLDSGSVATAPTVPDRGGGVQFRWLVS